MTDAEIRTAIHNTISPAVAPALVFKRWELSLTDRQNADLLRCEADVNAAGVPRIHGWMLTREADQPQQATASKFFENYRYRIWAFLSMEPGPDGDNSEDRFTAELEAVKAVLRANQTLGFNTSQSQLLIQQPLTFSEIDTYPLGDEIVHLAKGSLTLRVTTQI